MNNLLLPDLFAMTILLGVLLLVRRRYPRHDIRLWLGGLLLILLECVARILYGIRLPVVWHQGLHVISLVAYFLAGVLFLRSSWDGPQRLPRANLFAAINVVPGLLLLTEYAAGAINTGMYAGTGLAGMAVAVASSLLLRRPRSYAALLFMLWLPVTGATLAHAPRYAVYLLLAGLYLAVAGTFFWSLPTRSSGKVAVVTGFVVWAGCFATHPWIATSHPGFIELASEVWNLQKFLITVGFLLVLFERQVESNEWLALHDQLTGLPNRRLFQDRMGNAVARAERDRTALILFCLDLNHFKEVNDTFGHDAGDAVLRSVAASLQQVVRRTDTLARMGGDEFTLLATDVRAVPASRKQRRWLRAAEGAIENGEEGDLQGGEPEIGDDGGGPQGDQPLLRHRMRIERNIRAAVDRPVVMQSISGTRTIEISVSIGVAVYPTDGTDLAELTRIADQRMYEDKRRQGNARGGLDRVLSLLTTQ